MRGFLQPGAITAIRKEGEDNQHLAYFCSQKHNIYLTPTDPDFDPAVKAVYYVRVLEIPTPRWTLYDKVNLGAEPGEEVPLTHQERAFSSPIWYTP